MCVCVCEEAGYTRGTEDKKYIYIYSAGGSHYGCVSYAKEADGKRKNNEFIYTHSVNNNEKGKKKKQLQGSTYGEHGAEKENKHRCKIECRQQVWHTSNQVEGTRGFKTAKEDDLCFCAKLLFFFPTLSLPRLNRSYVGFVPFFPYQKYGKNMLFSCNTECSK